jgi:hypothetical protein
MSEDIGQIIEADEYEPSHYAMIPKMAMLDLDPYELTLYCHYKMTASENGKCWKSNKSLATETGMSIRRLQEARDTLASKGFITLTYAPDDSGNINTPPVITIVSVWSENRSRYAKKDAPPMHSVHTPLAPDAPPHALSASKEYPSEEKELKKDTRKRVTHPSNSKQKPLPTNRKTWQWEHIERYAAENPAIDELAAYDNLGFNPILKRLTTKYIAMDCIALYEELQRNGVETSSWHALYTEAMKGNRGDNYSVFQRMLWALPNWLKGNCNITVLVPEPQAIDLSGWFTPESAYATGAAHDNVE